MKTGRDTRKEGRTRGPQEFSSLLGAGALFPLLFFLLPLAGPSLFYIDGDIGPAAIQSFDRVDLQSLDFRFVAHASVGRGGQFSFYKVPEGLYKLKFISANGRELERSVEIRPAFADAQGRIPVRIVVQEGLTPGDQLKVGIAALHVSSKAASELRRAYDAGGDVVKVRQHLEKAIEISPEFDEALNYLGALDFRQGRFQEAAGLFQRALKANPDLYSARVNLGGAWSALGDYPRALAENLRCLEMRPDDSLAEAQTGQVLFEMKRYDEAMPHLEKALQLDPMSFTLPGLFIAQIREIQGHTDAAIAAYREFLQVHPGHEMTALIESRLRVLEAVKQSR